ncbi:hypothetical protein MBR_06356, partial [Metarhizium brunneum ARSEF 3297]
MAPDMGAYCPSIVLAIQSLVERMSEEWTAALRGSGNSNSRTGFLAYSIDDSVDLETANPTVKPDVRLPSSWFIFQTDLYARGAHGSHGDEVTYDFLWRHERTSGLTEPWDQSCSMHLDAAMVSRLPIGSRYRRWAAMWLLCLGAADICFGPAAAKALDPKKLITAACAVISAGSELCLVNFQLDDPPTVSASWERGKLISGVISLFILTGPFMSDFPIHWMDLLNLRCLVASVACGIGHHEAVLQGIRMGLEQPDLERGKQGDCDNDDPTLSEQAAPVDGARPPAG